MKNKGVTAVLGSVLMLGLMGSFFGIVYMMQNAQMNFAKELVDYINDIEFTQNGCESKTDTDNPYSTYDPDNPENNKPLLVKSYPYDKYDLGTNVDLMPNCTVHVYDLDTNDTLNVTFFYRKLDPTNTPEWILAEKVHLEEDDHIATWKYFDAVEYDTTYFWMVDVNDGETSISNVYSFTTIGV